MSNVWYTSDLHFGHKFVAGLRGFDVKEHDEFLIDYWSSTVKKDDLVFILGDLVASNPDHGLDILSKLPGRKVLVSGNHDKIHPDFRRDVIREATTAKYNKVFVACQPFFRRKVNGIEFLLSHFPYSGDHTDEDRFDQYRLRDYGVPLLHGHTHDKNQREHDGYQLHVGWDAWGEFLNQDAISEWLSGLTTIGVRK